MDWFLNCNKTNKRVPFVVSFDEYGNLYFEIYGDLSSKCYQLNINNNDPFFEQGTYQIINPYDKKKFNLFTVLDKETSLKAKVKKRKQLEKEENEESFSDEEYDLDGDKRQDYFEEENDICIDDEGENDNNDIDEDNQKMYGLYNKKFNFSTYSTLNEPIKVNNRQNGDIMALYDTYIYENCMVFRSKSSDNSSIYIVNVYLKENIILIRPVGSPEKKFKLLINEEGDLSFIKID